MPQHAATIESLPMAFEMMKEMQADGLDWSEDDRPLGRQALSETTQDRMAEAVDRWLDSLDGCAMRDRRNGFYARHLLSALGDIELRVPRTRRFLPDRAAEELLHGTRRRSSTRSWPVPCSAFRPASWARSCWPCSAALTTDTPCTASAPCSPTSPPSPAIRSCLACPAPSRSSFSPGLHPCRTKSSNCRRCAPTFPVEKR